MPADRGRLIPALPTADSRHGQIRWGRWEAAISVNHFDPSCDACGFPGPLSTCFGTTWYTPEPTWVRVRRSDWRRGLRSQWARAQPPPFWCRTHWARRCPRCDETVAWRREGWQEVFYRPPAVEAVTAACPAAMAGQGVLF